MSKNLIKRVITSIILLTILLISIFSNNIVFILSLFTLSGLICFEANNIFQKMLNKKKEFSSRFLFLNILTFLYVFLIFFQFSYKIHKMEGPIFFLLVISICFFSDIGGYFIGKLIGGKKLSKISPNKTISGTIGSFIFSLIPLLVMVQLLWYRQNYYTFLLFVY